ncbi:UNVERIFIED_CONTAM: Multiple C2 and transmembrane domain-containing protein 1 [Sesamum latifolium]|uniref:Multiple C2 and transmembrane domain-containing protein 1 n=1 Tax=Sesamum latifolium TaxID=2727402 RepID=A0AAW2SLS4_9LAMI
MGRTKKKLLDFNEAVGSLKKLLEEQPLLPFVIPLLFVLWAIERWFFSLSNWVLLAVAVWAAIQVQTYIMLIRPRQLRYQMCQGNIALSNKFMMTASYGSYQRQHIVEDFNKKLMQVTLQSSPVTPIEHCEWLNKLLLEVWSNYVNPKLSLRFAFIVERRLKHLKSKLIEKIELQEFSLGSRPPLFGLHGMHWATSGDQRIMHCSFDWDTDDVNILLFAKLAMPLMGTARIVVNSIHIKGHLILMPILEGKAMTYSFVSTPDVRIGVAFGSGGSQSLPATELPGVSSWLIKLATDTLNKRLVEPRRQCLALPAEDLQKKAIGGILYVTVLSASKLSASNLKGCASTKHINSSEDSYTDDRVNRKELQTFLEIELGELTRRTDVRAGSSPKWDTTFNLILHDNAGILRFHLYERTLGNVKYDYLTSCEIKMRYVPDDSTIFWAIGPNSAVIAKHAERCGKEIEMTVPFEGVNLGEDLVVKDKIGKSDPYVKLQYGKVIQRTKAVPHSPNPTWNQKFEFDEIGVNSGELRLQIEALKVEDNESSKGSHGTSANAWIELVLIEARDLVAADLRGTSDPYVRVHYGNMKKSTKVMYKTLNPQWHQTLEFPDDGSPLTLYVKDHNTLLPTSNIGDCVVEYQMLPPNQMADKWIPLQGVRRGEIHIQITRKVPELEKKPSVDYESSPTTVRHQISNQMKEMMIKLRSQVDENDLEGVSKSLTELESLHDTQEEFMVQLETEQTLLIDKVNELGQEIFNASPTLHRTSTIP